MKIEIDFETKTISVKGEVNLNDLFEFLEKMLPDGQWKSFKLETQTVMQGFGNPIIIKEFIPYPLQPFVPVSPYPSTPVDPFHPYCQPTITICDTKFKDYTTNSYPVSTGTFSNQIKATA